MARHRRNPSIPRAKNAAASASKKGTGQESGPQHEAENAGSANELLAEIIDNSPDLIAAVNTQYKYIAFNEAYRKECQKIFGVEFRIGASLVELLQGFPEDQKSALALFGRALKGETIAVTEEFGRPGEARQSYELRFSPIRDSTGKVTGAAQIGRNITERKGSEEALREGEARFRAVLENMSEGVMLFDRQQNLFYQNQASLRIHGFGKDEQGQIQRDDLPTTWKAWDATGRPITFEEWPVSRVFRGERFQDQVLRVVRVETGQEFFGSYNGSPVFDSSGELSLGFITIRDITEQKRAEDAARASEEKFRAVFESTSDCILVWDRDYNYLYANQAAIEHVGTTPDKVIGKNIRDGLGHVPDFMRLWMSRVDRAFATGKPFRVEDTVRVGERVVHSESQISPIRDAAGKVFAVGVVYRDVTERKEVQEALQKSEERFRVAQELSPDGFSIFHPVRDEQGRVVDFTWVYENATIARLNGTDPKAVVGKRLLDLFPGHRGSPFFKAYQEVAETGQPKVLEAPYHGDTIVTLTWFRVVVVSMGTDIAVLAQDITERKRFQAELERLVAERTARLQELVADLEHFSYTITHDMRAPLRAMMGFAELLNELNAGNPDAQQREFLNRIVTSARRMDLLITDALNFSRVVRQEMSLEAVDTGALLRSMLDTYPELQPSKAQIRLEGRLPVVLGNEAGLTQCFSNLLGNAVKFVQPGRTPEVRVWAEVLEDHRVGTQQRVRIWVEDQGIGIPPQMLPKVFQMFTRASVNYEGTGIGLALVRKVVERMGGKVGVESEEGKGSRFWLELRAVER